MKKNKQKNVYIKKERFETRVSVGQQSNIHRELTNDC